MLAINLCLAIFFMTNPGQEKKTLKHPKLVLPVANKASRLSQYKLLKLTQYSKVLLSPRDPHTVKFCSCCT